MAGADNFAVEQAKALAIIDWINSYARANGLKFEAKLAGYSINTTRFGAFEAMRWQGDWSAARTVTKKVSSKLGVKVVESGYHEKRGLLSAMLGGAEYAKVYDRGRLVGQLELESRSGRWQPKAEKTM